MVSTPSDLPELDFAAERARMDEALAPLVADGRVEIRWLEDRTWHDLQLALLDGPWHVFHFIGHGSFDEQLGEGVLALCDEAGATHRLSATDLGVLLGDQDSIRLAVLNACEGDPGRPRQPLLELGHGSRPTGNARRRGDAVPDQRPGRRRAGADGLRRAGERSTHRRRPRGGAEGGGRRLPGQLRVGHAGAVPASPRRQHLRRPAPHRPAAGRFGCRVAGGADRSATGRSGGCALAPRGPRRPRTYDRVPARRHQGVPMCPRLRRRVAAGRRARGRRHGAGRGLPPSAGAVPARSPARSCHPVAGAGARSNAGVV